MLRNLILFATIMFLISCNDKHEVIGSSVQPNNDKVVVDTASLVLSVKTKPLDSVYSIVRKPILGEYIDNKFGHVKSNYIGQFYYGDSIKFKNNPVIDSVKLNISYTTFWGDSSSPTEVSVYKTNKDLDKNRFYTNTNPKEYADISSKIGSALFVGDNSDYINAISDDGENYKIYNIGVPFPKKIGEDLLNASKNNSNAEAFRKILPGVFVDVTFGQRTIVKVDETVLNVYYKYTDIGGSSKNQDTIREDVIPFLISDDVAQMNYVENKNESLLENNEKEAYVVSPSGVFSEIKFPLDQIKKYESIKNEYSNSVKGSISVNRDAYVQDDQLVKLLPPDQLLLISKDSINDFFVNKKLPDNKTTFLLNFDPRTYTYSIDNIAPLFNFYRKENKDISESTFCLIPVDVTMFLNPYSGASVIQSIYNKMSPSAAVINKESDNITMNMIFSYFK